MTRLSFCGPHADLNVVAQARETVHQLALRKIGEVAAHHVGHFGLGNAHSLGRCLLRQAQGAHSFPDLDHQASFDLELVSIRQTKVGKRIV